MKKEITRTNTQRMLLSHSTLVETKEYKEALAILNRIEDEKLEGSILEVALNNKLDDLLGKLHEMEFGSK